jgi:DNA repair protein SbcC/Rad50
MIPLRLTLKNFLSYRQAALDFQGLHVACICGPNGAGKSSLLEAIAWVVWGQSRATSEDDIIHMGSKEAQVDFTFECRDQTYRIIRTRYRGQSSTLEFQVATPTGFRSLTERGLRPTQELILHHLRLDYQTFVNSAYLRQGRADEFMLKRPTERKQILGELLALDQYDTLSDQAKDLSRQLKGQSVLLEKSLEAIEQQLQQQAAIAVEQAQKEAELVEIRTAQEQEQQRLQILQTQQQQVQLWQEQQQGLQQQHHNLQSEIQRLQQHYVETRQQKVELTTVLEQEEAIAAGYTQFQQLQAQEEALSAKFQIYQSTQQQHLQLKQQQTDQVTALKQQLQQLEAQRILLVQQQQDLQHTLSKSKDVAAGLEHLRQAKANLSQFDQLQTQVFPMLQRQRELQSQMDRAQSRISARLDELKSSTQHLKTQQTQQPQLQQAVMEVTEQITYLEKRRIYQQHVREKGLERRHFIERLQAQQREYETQLAHLDQKMIFLGEPDALCPLCDRPLDEVHWQLVRQKHELQKQEILDQIWLMREQLVVSEREIQVLRQEYRDLEQELSQLSAILERRGQLQEQLHTTDSLGQRLEQMSAEAIALERSLQNQDFALSVEAELQQIKITLTQLNYDEKNHAIARGQVEHWRWAEIKQAELGQAQRRQDQIAHRLPELEAEIATVQEQIQHLLQHSELQQKLLHLAQTLEELDYCPDQHHTLRQEIRHQQDWQLKYQQLTQAQQQLPQVQQRLAAIESAGQSRAQEARAIAEQISHLSEQLQSIEDCSQSLRDLEQQVQQRQQQLEQKLAELGRLQQLQLQLTALASQSTQQQQQLETIRRQLRVFQELGQAFGKNGIQALMIENVLPQLEAETNQILGRLSSSQLHVQFVTQRAGKGSPRNAKLIDTLDILIADAHGTRVYETYSGGEAFRVNFAIRLALARLLAQRSGSNLQMLIIDEGFGTQDMEGCERLIAAINAIAADFACILTVTHMPSLKEAFQTRIEVTKTESGSQLAY